MLIQTSPISYKLFIKNTQTYNIKLDVPWKIILMAYLFGITYANIFYVNLVKFWQAWKWTKLKKILTIWNNLHFSTLFQLPTTYFEKLTEPRWRYYRLCGRHQTTCIWSSPTQEPYYPGFSFQHHHFHISEVWKICSCHHHQPCIIISLNCQLSDAAFLPP